MKERRVARRFSMNLPLEVRLASEGESSSTNAETRDISYRGLYFILDRELAPGTSIQFVLTLSREITLSDPVQIQCAGRVVRVEKSNSRDPHSQGNGQVGVAAVIERYDFLPFSS